MTRGDRVWGIMYVPMSAEEMRAPLQDAVGVYGKAWSCVGFLGG